MPAAGRSCCRPVRHSVRLSGPRRRRCLLSPDARGPPSAARSSRGPARRRAPPPPGPAPALLPVCPSVCPSSRPLALPSFCPAANPQAGLPAPPALSLLGSLSLCLCPRAASQPLPRSRVPPARSSHPLASHSERPHSSELPPTRRPHILRGRLSFRTPSTPLRAPL